MRRVSVNQVPVGVYFLPGRMLYYYLPIPGTPGDILLRRAEDEGELRVGCEVWRGPDQERKVDSGGRRGKEELLFGRHRDGPGHVSVDSPCSLSPLTDGFTLFFSFLSPWPACHFQWMMDRFFYLLFIFIMAARRQCGFCGRK